MPLSRRSFIYFLIILLVPPASPVSAQSALDGHWEGGIIIQTYQLIIRVDFKTVDGVIQATIDVPQQGAAGLTLKNVRFEPPKIHFELPAGLGIAIFDGELKGDVIAGTFMQAAVKGTFSLQRGPAQAAQTKPPEEDKIPYRQEEVRFSHGTLTFTGTLTLPESDGPHVAVVLLTGSGAQNRDEDIFGFKPFRILADHLTRSGVAVLRYDDRGIGGSSGDTSLSTTEEFADDALAAAQFLKSRKEIESRKIGLCGHSEGAIVAAIAASRSRDVAFIVMMSGIGVTGEQILLSQGEAIARAEGASDEELKRQANFQRRVFQSVRSGQGWEALRADLGREGLAQLEKLTPEQRKTISDPQASLEAAIEAQLRLPRTPWFKNFLFLDPAVYLARVKCPVLALFGELDLQVPVEENRRAISAALERGGNKEVTTHVFPGANHLYQQAKTGSPQEYILLKKEFVPGFLELVSRWIREKGGLPAGEPSPPGKF